MDFFLKKLGDLQLL